MREENLGALPVQDPDKDRLVGMITDRDIVTRCVASGKDGDARVSDVARARLTEMGQFMETVTHWYDQMIAVPAPKIMALMRMGARVANFLNFGRKGEG